MRSGLAWTGLAIAAAEALVGIAMSFAPNPEGRLGGLLYVAMYAVPTAAVAVAWASGRRWAHTVSGWAGLALAALYTAVAILNWSGYTPWEAVFVLVATVPAVLFDLVVFWALVLPSLEPRPASRHRRSFRP